MIISHLVVAWDLLSYLGFVQSWIWKLQDDLRKAWFHFSFSTLPCRHYVSHSLNLSHGICVFFYKNFAKCQLYIYVTFAKMTMMSLFSCSYRPLLLFHLILLLFLLVDRSMKCLLSAHHLYAFIATYMRQKCPLYYHKIFTNSSHGIFHKRAF